jgi:hypothetical protein
MEKKRCADCNLQEGCTWESHLICDTLVEIIHRKTQKPACAINLGAMIEELFGIYFPDADTEKQRSFINTLSRLAASSDRLLINGRGFERI